MRLRSMLCEWMNVHHFLPVWGPGGALLRLECVRCGKVRE